MSRYDTEPHYVYGTRPGDWVESAACASADPDLFFPDYTAGLASGREAKQVCNGCPVLDDCRGYALSVPWLQGVWGGLTSRELTVLRKRRNRSP